MTAQVAHACRDIGTRAADSCDNNSDCAEARYCKGGVCVADENIGKACVKSAECEVGSFCDNNFPSSAFPIIFRTGTKTCTAYLSPHVECYPFEATTGLSTGCTPLQHENV